MTRGVLGVAAMARAKRSKQSAFRRASSSITKPPRARIFSHANLCERKQPTSPARSRLRSGCGCSVVDMSMNGSTSRGPVSRPSTASTTRARRSARSSASGVDPRQAIAPPVQMQNAHVGLRRRFLKPPTELRGASLKFAQKAFVSGLWDAEVGS